MPEYVRANLASRNLGFHYLYDGGVVSAGTPNSVYAPDWNDNWMLGRVQALFTALSNAYLSSSLLSPFHFHIYYFIFIFCDFVLIEIIGMLMMLVCGVLILECMVIMESGTSLVLPILVLMESSVSFFLSFFSFKFTLS